MLTCWKIFHLHFGPFHLKTIALGIYLFKFFFPATPGDARYLERSSSSSRFLSHIPTNTNTQRSTKRRMTPVDAGAALFYNRPPSPHLLSTIQNDPVSLSDGSTPSGALCHRFGCCSSLEPPTTTRTIRRKLFCCLGFGLRLRLRLCRRWLEPSSKASFLLHSPFWKQLNYTQLINGGVPGASGWFVSTWTHLALGCRFFFCFLFASSSISAGNVLHEQIKKTFSAQHDKWICLKI